MVKQKSLYKIQENLSKTYSDNKPIVDLMLEQFNLMVNANYIKNVTVENYVYVSKQLIFKTFDQWVNYLLDRINQVVPFEPLYKISNVLITLDMVEEHFEFKNLNNNLDNNPTYIGLYNGIVPNICEI